MKFWIENIGTFTKQNYSTGDKHRRIYWLEGNGYIETNDTMYSGEQGMIFSVKPNTEFTIVSLIDKICIKFSELDEDPIPETVVITPL